MEIPDLSKYKEKFTENGFIEKIHRIAKRAGAKLVYAALILYYSIDSNKMSIKDKAIIIGGIRLSNNPTRFYSRCYSACRIGRRSRCTYICVTKGLGQYRRGNKTKGKKQTVAMVR